MDPEPSAVPLAWEASPPFRSPEPAPVTTPDSTPGPEDRPPPTSPPRPPYDPAPVFTNMPGSGKGAVVLLWIMFGFGICGGLGVVVATSTLLNLSAAQLDQVLSRQPWVLVVMVLSVLQIVVWTILRGVFAVKIPRRSRSARSGAVALEVLGIIVSIATWVILANIATPGPATGGPGEQTGSCIGLVLSLVIIGLLSTRDMHEWCDR